MNTKELIEILDRRLNNYKDKSEKPIANDFVIIIQVGNLTVTMNKNGLELVDENYPQQFSYEQTDKIYKKNFYDKDGETMPMTIYFSSAWYGERYIELKKLVDLLERELSKENISNEDLQKQYDYLEIQFNGINFELDEIFSLDEEENRKEILPLCNKAKEIKEKMDLLENIIYRNKQIESAKNKIKT